jgi:hypothetical protein
MQQRMKTIFDRPTREELIQRINKLNENSVGLWGQMNIFQMLKHCTLWQEMILGKTQYKQHFIGRLFGKIMLKNAVKDDTPMKRGTPTIPAFKNLERTGNVEAQKQQWISLIAEHAAFQNQDFIHPFFGKMTKEQIGFHAYKHIDHHLRQFNV